MVLSTVSVTRLPESNPVHEFATHPTRDGLLKQTAYCGLRNIQIVRRYFPMDELHAVEPLGFALPTPAYLAGAIMFGFVGFAAYRYGKSTSRPNAKWIGIALMVYPYVVSETWLMYAVGLGLCTGLYWCRE